MSNENYEIIYPNEVEDLEDFDVLLEGRYICIFADSHKAPPEVTINIIKVDLSILGEIGNHKDEE